MAKFEGILQQFSGKNSHGVLLNTIASLQWVQEIIFSVAYARQEGVQQIKAAFSVHKPVAFVGCANGVTSAQAMLELLSFTKRLYAIDTANPSVIFHPKIFLFQGKNNAELVLGSANLTLGGLNNNFEIGARLAVDLGQLDEQKEYSAILSAIHNLPSQFPSNVTEIKDRRQIVKMLEDGLLADERKPLPRINGQARLGRGAKRTAINVPVIRSTIKRRYQRKAIPINVTAPLTLPQNALWQLLWTSNILTERDLCIPTGNNTNPTGSMLFKKGAATGIDQRTHFRDNIFQNLAWAVDTKKPKWERATARFFLVINGVHHGIFELMLSHNTDKDSKTYAQKNSMTQLHWGKAASLVKQPVLLGRTLKLYYSNLPTGEFIVEIG
jgi:hypothetical protein